MFGCLGRTLALVGLVAIVALAWRHGPALYDEVRGVDAALPTLEPSVELAEDAELRIREFADGGVQHVSLSGVELESLLLFRYAEAWPEGVSAPTVTFRDGDLILGLRLERERIPRLPELDGILGFLPDTVPVQLRGRVLALAGGEAALLVHRIDASSIPIPRRFFPRILESVQGPGRDDLPPEALLLPLPEGVRSVRVVDDRLHLARIE
jgi:hypothetical protein